MLAGRRRCCTSASALCLGMWTFGLIMLVGCASFLPNEAVRQLVERLTRTRVTAAGTVRSHEARGRARGEHRGRTDPVVAIASANGVAH